MSKKTKILAAVAAAGIVIIIVLGFVLTHIADAAGSQDSQSSQSSASSGGAASASVLEETLYIGSHNTKPVSFDPERVAEMRNALLEAGYTAVDLAHPFEGAELFYILETPTGMDIPIEGEEGGAGGTGATNEEEIPEGDEDANNHPDSGEGARPSTRYAFLFSNGVRMTVDDYVLSVNVLNDIRRADNGGRIYPMLSQEQADLASEMWSAAEQVKRDGSHPGQENPVILNGRMIPNAGFIIRGDTLYLPIEKIAKTYCSVAEVSSRCKTVIRFNGQEYTFYGEKLSGKEQAGLGIENGEFAVQNPAGMDEEQASFPLYSRGGYIEADTIAKVLGWQIENHSGYVEIVSDPLDVNTNFAVLPEHDMKFIDAWFMDKNYTLFGWDEYSPEFS